MSESERFRIVRPNLVKEIDSQGIKWDMQILNLAGRRGISVRLRPEALPSELVLLDYSDLAHPTTARLHLSPGSNENDPLPARMNRIRLWTQAIVALDEMMTSVSDTATASEINALVDTWKLPRVTNCVADTSHPGIRTMLAQLGFKENPNPPHALEGSWSSVIEKARSVAKA